MTPVEAVLVALAGAAGAWLRHLLTTTAHPVRATAAVNVVGGGALGAASVVLPPAALLVVGGGLLGGVTTFSTWMVQADEHQHRWWVLAVPVVLGLAMVALGRMLAGVVA